MLAFRGSTFLHSLSTMEVFAHHLSSYMYIYIISIILYIYIYLCTYIFVHIIGSSGNAWKQSHSPKISLMYAYHESWEFRSQTKKQPKVGTKKVPTAGSNHGVVVLRKMSRNIGIFQHEIQPPFKCCGKKYDNSIRFSWLVQPVVSQPFSEAREDRS